MRHLDLRPGTNRDSTARYLERLSFPQNPRRRKIICVLRDDNLERFIKYTQNA